MGEGAHGTALSSTFYANDTLGSQKQGAQTISYALDPAGRTRETVSTGTINESVISHYTSQGDSPAWTVNGAGTWIRYISGLGGLAAIQTNGGTPELQLENLHGDIVAKAALSETETKLLSSTDTTEFGVPTVGTPAKYSWLGAEQRPTELSSGMIAMGVRSYIPQLGRFEQPDPQPGGSGDAYEYASGDPINSSDLSGEWASTVTYDLEAAGTGSAAAGLSEHYIVPGAVMPPAVDPQIEAEFNAHPPWDAVSAAAATGSSRGGNPLNLVELAGGYPPAFICNTRPPSRWGSYKHYCEKYKKEEGSPWEPVEAICAMSPLAGVCNVIDKVKTVKRIGHGTSSG